MSFMIVLCAGDVFEVIREGSLGVGAELLVVLPALDRFSWIAVIGVSVSMHVIRGSLLSHSISSGAMRGSRWDERCLLG